MAKKKKDESLVPAEQPAEVPVEAPPKKKIGRPKKPPGAPKSPYTPRGFKEAAEDGTNVKILTGMLATRKIAERYSNRENPDTFYKCLEEYVKYCLENNLRITNLGCYAACGISKMDVDNWADGRKRKGDPRYRDFALFVRQFCSEYRESLMMTGKLNPVTGIWWQKAYDHYTDMPVIETQKESPLGESLSAKQLEEKYANVVFDEDE